MQHRFPTLMMLVTFMQEEVEGCRRSMIRIYRKEEGVRPPQVMRRSLDGSKQRWRALLELN
jgi:hypothetical protein